MSFFTPNYEIPSTSRYMKYEDGDNTFRILGSFEKETAIMGMEYWKTIEGKRKPIRVRMGITIPISELEEREDGEGLDMPKHFWALPVWNYAQKQLQILEITQKTIMTPIKSLASNPKWGDPFNYDLVVTRSKEGGKTTYTVTPNPKDDIPEEALKSLKETPLHIEALFDGKDPFADTTGEDVAEALHIKTTSRKR